MDSKNGTNRGEPSPFVIPDGDLSELSSEIAKRQWELRGQTGAPLSETRKLAVQEYAALYDVDGETLQRGIAKAMSERAAKAHNGNDKPHNPFARNGKNGVTDAVERPTLEIEPATGNGHKRTLRETFREYAATHDFIPSDEAISFFTGRASGTVAAARAELVHEGYTFERVNGSGWRVTGRSDKRAEAIEGLKELLAQTESARAAIVAQLESLKK